MRIAGWIPKATNIHLEYETVTAFLLQQWLRGPSSMLTYTYILPVFFFILLPLNAFTTYGAPKPRACEKFNARAVHRSLLRTGNARP